MKPQTPRTPAVPGAKKGGTPKAETAAELAELRPGQSVELLKELHILTREGRLNQDSRRKLKQVYHLFNFIEPLLTELSAKGGRGRADPGGPRSRQVLSGLHTVRPLLQGPGARPYLWR